MIRLAKDVLFTACAFVVVAIVLTATGCAPSQPAKAPMAQASPETEKAVSLGFWAAAEVHNYFAAKQEAEYDEKAETVKAAMRVRKAAGEDVKAAEFHEAMAAWERETGWAMRVALASTARKSLLVLRSYLRSGAVSRTEALEAVDAALGALGKLADKHDLPAGLTDTLALARFALPRLVP